RFKWRTMVSTQQQHHQQKSQQFVKLSSNSSDSWWLAAGPLRPNLNWDCYRPDHRHPFVGNIQPRAHPRCNCGGAVDWRLPGP
ncbi:hypothetical protein Ancab_010368, partial [Ancistrocladus abbreviatus]